MVAQEQAEELDDLSRAPSLVRRPLQAELEKQSLEDPTGPARILLGVAHHQGIVDIDKDMGADPRSGHALSELLRHRLGHRAETPRRVDVPKRKAKASHQQPRHRVSHQHPISRARVDRHVEETVSQVPLGKVRARLDHVADVEHCREPERRGVGLEVGTLRVVLARPPLILLLHHGPWMHRRVAAEQLRRLSRRHVLKRTQQNMAVGLKAADALRVGVAPFVLIDLIETERFLAADAMAL